MLIALNAAQRKSRGVICRLAATLSQWIDLDSANVTATALRLGLGPGSLRFALALLARADRLAEAEEARAAEREATLITLLDAEYPRILRDLALPPPVLYCRGKLLQGPALAIVGSRRADPYGLEVAEQFSARLASHGATVVSGLALGIDSAAHRGALAADGKTIAVLGCGIDSVYPRANTRLAAEIAVKGAILSEFPIGAPPNAWHFPIRNRIIAALSVGTLVVRATPRSGSLITVRHALDLGRDVYAVPANIFDRRSVGPNTLIREGALCVQHPRDIVESLPSAVQDQLSFPGVDAEGATAVPARLGPLLEILPLDEAVPQDEIVSRSKLSIDDALSGLLELEMGGWIRRFPGPAYSRRSKMERA